jgi:type II secretory pathway predicted ATPase ExeA
MDPFGVTCDPRAYVARPATEAALVTLAGALALGRRVCTLSGPPGLGKTLLLRVLEERLAGEADCIALPYAALGVDDLARWVLGLLGHDPVASPDPVAFLVAHATDDAREGRPLVLLLDDASALPLDAARRCVELCAETEGALRLIVVPVDDGRAGRVIGALGEGVVHTRLTAPMSPEETRRYVTGRLDYGAADAVLRARFDDGLVAWLHRESGGNPRRLQALSTWVLHRDSLPEEAVASVREGAVWLDPGCETGDVDEDKPDLEIDDEDTLLEEAEAGGALDEAAPALVDNATAGS